MKLLRHFVIVLVALGMLNLSSCEWRKKPKLPKTATAPTKTPEPEGPKPVTPQPVEQPEIKDTTPVPVEATTNTTKPKPKPTKRVAKKVVPAEPPPAATTPQPTTNPKTGESNVQITAELPKSGAMRQNTAQLIDTTEANLKKITRTLNDNEQAMVRQIRTYITQAKLASDDGDLERAYNLATKANLLSNELIK